MLFGYSGKPGKQPTTDDDMRLKKMERSALTTGSCLSNKTSFSKGAPPRKKKRKEKKKESTISSLVLFFYGYLLRFLRISYPGKSFSVRNTGKENASN